MGKVWEQIKNDKAAQKALLKDLQTGEDSGYLEAKKLLKEADDGDSSGISRKSAHSAPAPCPPEPPTWPPTGSFAGQADEHRFQSEDPGSWVRAEVSKQISHAHHTWDMLNSMLAYTVLRM